MTKKRLKFPPNPPPDIKTRSAHFRLNGEQAHRDLAQRFLAGHGLPVIVDWKPQGEVTPFLNDGRWIAECPNPLCGGAELVDPDWPLFVCSSGCGAGPYTVKFPKDVKGVEAKYIAENWKDD